MPGHERQSISRGELRGVLHAMLSRVEGERMVVVVDSEYIFKAITMWTEKWKRHGWRTSSGEVGHRDLWEHIDWLRGEAGDKLQVRWVPRGGRLLGSGTRLPPPLPALRAHLVAKGQQLLAIHMVAPKAPEFFFSFPLPILSTLHPNTILEPNLDSNAHPNPQPTPNPTHKPYP